MNNITKEAKDWTWEEDNDPQWIYFLNRFLNDDPYLAYEFMLQNRNLSDLLHAMSPHILMAILKGETVDFSGLLESEENASVLLDFFSEVHNYQQHLEE